MNKTPLQNETYARSNYGVNFRVADFTKELKITILLDIDVSLDNETQKIVPLEFWHLKKIGNQDVLDFGTDIDLKRPIARLPEYEGHCNLTCSLNPSNIYPFDEYSLNLTLYPFEENFNITKIFSQTPNFELDSKLNSLWALSVKRLWVEARPDIIGDNRSMLLLTLVIGRQSYTSVTLVLPIYLALVLLYLTTFISTNDRNWLSNRISVYISMFVFGFVYEGFITSNAPQTIGITIAEMSIYFVALDTILLFFILILKHYQSRPRKGFSVILSDLGIVAIVNFFFAQFVFANFIYTIVIVGTPCVILILRRILEFRRLDDIDYLFDYTSTAILEGLYNNTLEGINQLINVVKNRIKPNKRQKESPEKIKGIIEFLSDIFIDNVSKAHIRKGVLEGYEEIFFKGIESSSDVTYLVTTQTRLISLQITNRSNILALRELLHFCYRLLCGLLDEGNNQDKNLTVKEREARKNAMKKIIDDAGMTFRSVSKDIIREGILPLFTLNINYIGGLLIKITEKLESKEDQLNDLLDLLKLFSNKSEKSNDPDFITTIHEQIDIVQKNY